MISELVSYIDTIRKVYPLLFVVVFYSAPAVSQNKIINLEEIHQKKVRKYIVSRSIDKMADFSLIHSSWKKNNNESEFNVIEKTFYLKYKLPNVWENYRHANLAKIWNCNSVRFGLMIEKCSNTVIYTNNSFFPDIDTGQVFFLNIRIIKGLFNVPVAFEITNIDPEKQIVEFSYIDGNKSLGKQSLQFFESGNGTRIVHRSYYKSDSSLRDKLIYPGFHKKFIREFHKNIWQQIRSSSITVQM